MSTLLDKALAAHSAAKRRQYGPEEIAVALAWMRGDVVYSSVARALDLPPTNSTVVYCFLASALRAAYTAGQLTIVEPSRQTPAAAPSTPTR